jgi:hypothetical protein
MPNLAALSTGTKIVLGAGVLLFIDLFFAWQSIDLPDPFGSVSQNAWHGFWGVVLGILVIALLVWMVIQIANVNLNMTLPVSDAQLTLGLAVVIFLFALIKNLVDDYSAWASYVGVVLAAGVAIGAWLRMQEAEDTGMRAAPTTTAPPPAEPPASSPPPPAEGA